MTPDLHIRFPLGAAVRKISGPEWQGVVVGYYSSSFTPEGLVIECTAPGARGQVHVEPAKRMERAMTQTPDLDYPVANPPDIAPIIFRAMILQAMAMQYFNYMRDAPEDFSLDEAFDAARATWETDWEIDPYPRTMEAAKEEVSNDLAYWNEE